MPFDAKLLAVIDELDQLGQTRDDAWQVPRAEAEMLHHIALAMNARTIVEVGTSYGFSGLFWAAAMQQTGGRLHTIDKDPKKFESSKQTFARAGIDQFVMNYLGDAQQLLSTKLKDLAPIDLAFIDADKPATGAYFDLLWPRVRAGGSILIDNATTHREQLGDLIRTVRARSDVRSIEIAIGNGIEWIIKLPG
jgi:predicted O-methyltransferase YrrM